MQIVKSKNNNKWKDNYDKKVKYLDICLIIKHQI